MKQEIKPATGRLGVLVVGVGGAVATTMIVGTLASRKGLAKPIGSITQLATMRMENNEEKLIKDVVPLTDLNDIVFGGWDIFPAVFYEGRRVLGGAFIASQRGIGLVIEQNKDWK